MLTTVIGPMFSSKTTTLLMYEKKFYILKKKVCMIKHSFDTRYTEDKQIVNHDGSTSMHSDVFITDKLLNIKEICNTYDCILIDEGQFFPDLFDFCTLFSKDKRIIVAGLISDFKKKPFLPMIEILPICDKITHLTALCTVCGEEASFTSRIIDNTSQTFVGSSESYQPRCGKCHTIPHTI